MEKKVDNDNDDNNEYNDNHNQQDGLQTMFGIFSNSHTRILCNSIQT